MRSYKEAQGALLMKWIIALLAISTTGCVTHKPLRLPDGRAGYAISCPGTGRSWADCMANAAELCGTYEIVQQNGESTPIYAENTAIGTGALVTAVHRQMVIACH